MIKVELANRWFSLHSLTATVEYQQEVNELKQWCNQNFGPSIDKSVTTKIQYMWTTRVGNDELLYIDEWYDDIIYPIFYFKYQEHADWFKLRWK